MTVGTHGLPLVVPNLGQCEYYIRNGSLKAVKVGRSIRLKESDLELFINKTKVPSQKLEIELRFLLDDRQVIEEKLIQNGAKVVYQGRIIDHWYVPSNIKTISEIDVQKRFGGK